MTLGQLIKSLRPTRTEHWIMISILLYTISSLLGGFVSPFISKLFLYTGCIIYLFILVTRWKGIPLEGISRLWLFLLVIWTICLTFHMIFLFDLNTVKTGDVNRGFISTISFALDSLPFFPHLLPLCICCFPRNYHFDLRFFVRMISLVAVAFIILYPFAFSRMTAIRFQDIDDYINGVEASKYATLSIRLLIPATISLYLKKYLPNKTWWLFMIAFIGGIIANAYMGRRGGTATSILYLGLLWYVYTTGNKGGSKISAFFAGVLMLAAGFVIFSNLSDTFFSYIVERGLEDNRTDRNMDFMMDVFAGNDWIYGRGWFGQYYDSVYGYRYSIETGYFALLLRGGVVYLIPYVSILILTFINGFFRSNNILCKAFGVMAVMQLIELYPWGWPAFTFNFFALWIGVFICNKPYYRKLTDSQIKSKYF